MTAKQQKTEAELTTLLIAEIRKHPKLAHIQGVAITRPVQLALHHPNWGVSWVIDGSSSAPLEADQIGRNLQNQFDLILAS
jgi:hypothetical protein